MDLQGDIVAACLMAHEGTVKRAMSLLRICKELSAKRAPCSMLLAACGAFAVSVARAIPAAPPSTAPAAPGGAALCGVGGSGRNERGFLLCTRCPGLPLQTRAVALRGANRELLP